jgi:hypothetical protein
VPPYARAWASAVQRDPQSYEGLSLQCDESNEKLRDVYQSYVDKAEDMVGAVLMFSCGSR